jgi:hypothetical protein
VIVVVAGRHDAAAKAFVERGAAAGVALLAPSDLSHPGWRFRLDRRGNPSAATAVVGGELVDAGAIDGVLTRLPQVSENDLGQIVPADRAYVAAEMSAFLLAWLSALPCPVLNRPTPSCLAGPCWAPERWVHLAARLGIPVRPVRRRAADAGIDPAPTNEESDGPAITVTVVGKHCLGTSDPRLAGQARRLATVAGADLLAVHFALDAAAARLVSADPWPDVSSPEVAEAVRAYLTGQDR